MITEGYTVLVTWPDFSIGRHKQEVWYARFSEQADAVAAVQNASGALNDAKIEILSSVAEQTLVEQGLARSTVKKANPGPEFG